MKAQDPALAALLQQAVGHHRAGRLREAEQGYRRILSTHPQHPDALHLLGVVATQAGHAPQGAELIGKAIALQPRRKEFHANLANALRAQGRPGEAAEALRQAIAIDPGDAGLQGNLGVMLQEAGDLEAARSAFLRALELAPERAELHNNLGLVEQDRRDLAAAEAAYRHALELQPRYPEALNHLALCLLEAGRAEEGEAAVAEAIRLQPDYVFAWVTRGSLLRAAGRSEDALAAFREAERLGLQAPGLYVNLGEALKELARRPEAIEAFRRAVALGPRDARARAALGGGLMSEGRLEEAAEVLREAVELEPRLAEARHTLARVLSALGEEGAALESLEAAAGLAPGSAEIRCDLGMLRFSDRDPAPALADFEAALARDPGHVRAAFYRLVCRDLLGEPGDEAAWDRLRRRGAGLAALADSWSHARTRRGPQTRVFATSFQTLGHALETCSVEGLVLEFGVLHGTSLRFIAGREQGPVHGFDSFEGLPEAWGPNPAGSYSTGGERPAMPANVTLHAGFFDRSLPPFLADHEGPLRFGHIDCDLYSSTRDVFAAIAPRIVPGTVLVFDEYFCFASWREDEFKAFQEAVADQGWAYDYLAFNPFTKQAAVIIG